MQRMLCAEPTPGPLVLDREVDVLLGGAQPLVHVAALGLGEFLVGHLDLAASFVEEPRK
ncbi:hypothetical protein [Streptomyces sp. NPDC021608]|uniref:hypothetical protein n=1 Tax=Streptomyces sp. NPDC021608 TaxID=3154903 RepID=UPI0033FC6595